MDFLLPYMMVYDDTTVEIATSFDVLYVERYWKHPDLWVYRMCIP